MGRWPGRVRGLREGGGEGRGKVRAVTCYGRGLWRARVTSPGNRLVGLWRGTRPVDPDWGLHPPRLVPSPSSARRSGTP